MRGVGVGGGANIVMRGRYANDTTWIENEMNELHDDCCIMHNSLAKTRYSIFDALYATSNPCGTAVAPISTPFAQQCKLPSSALTPQA